MKEQSRQSTAKDAISDLPNHDGCRECETCHDTRLSGEFQDLAQALGFEPLQLTP